MLRTKQHICVGYECLNYVKKAYLKKKLKVLCYTGDVKVFFNLTVILL